MSAFACPGKFLEPAYDLRISSLACRLLAIALLGLSPPCHPQAPPPGAKVVPPDFKYEVGTDPATRPLPLLSGDVTATSDTPEGAAQGAICSSLNATASVI